MSRIARYAKATAKPGEGDALTELLLQAADEVRKAPGCDLYIVNRVPGETDTIWVTELWESEVAMNRALELARAADDGLMRRVMDLVEAFERVDLEPVGGVGLDPRPQLGWARVALDQLDDQAPGFGLADVQEFRSPIEALGLERTGLSLQHLLPGQRTPFGHHHHNAEETYVVLSGSGTLRVDDDEIALAARDAVRVAPTLTRAFLAGPDGLEYLAFGPRARGDGDIVPGWWGS